MKTNKFFYLSFLLCTLALGFTSCEKEEDEDDGVSLELPQYSEESARYEITEYGSRLKSVEFTGSGDFVIIYNTSYNRSGNSMEEQSCKYAGVAVSPWAHAATRYGNYVPTIITGKFTKKGDTYILEGFGQITVTNDDGSIASLVIKEDGQSSYTLTAAVAEQYEGSERTLNLCRTWNVKKLRLKVSAVGFKFDETTMDGDLGGLMLAYYREVLEYAAKEANKQGENVTQDMIDEALEEIAVELDNPRLVIKQFLFSQSGTYMVTYGDESLAIATWSWEDKNSNVLNYSWDYGSMESELSGEAKISFKDNNCIITEEQEMDGVKMTMTYTLEE